MKQFILLTMLIAIALVSLAQGPKGKSGGGGGAGGGSGSSASTSSPASASSPAANTGGQQTGYVYRLRHWYHIHYATSTSKTKPMDKPKGAPANEVWAITATDKRVIECDTVNKETQEPQRQMNVTDPCKVNIDTRRDVRKDTVRTCAAVCGPAAPSTMTTVTKDSVSRFWDRPRELFKRWRLRVAVTQGDSGKLQIAMYDNDFPDHTGHFGNEDIIYTEIVVGRNRTPDHAIPISAADSAGAFYLQINNKALANDPLVYISLPYALTQYGAFTIPFKYRFAPKNTRIYTKGPQIPADSIIAAPSESTGSINAAFYIGRKWGRTRFYYDQTKTKNTISFMLSGFVGPTLVSLSNANVAWPHTTDSLPSQSIAVSLGAAATIEWRGIDLGLFTGADYALAKHLNWIYDKKIWVGFGLGVNLGMFASGPTQFQL